MSDKIISFVVASDVGLRDGIGVETYINEDLVMEIFRDDTEKRTYMKLFSDSVDLSLVEVSIARFKDSIDSGYLD